MAVKANHHYIPQFYLRGFAEGAKRKAKVFTFDSSTKLAFTTLVRNVGSKRHFNQIDVEGVDPNAIEDSLADVEALFAQHLAEVIRVRSFPTHDHFNSIMNLIALISVRNPRLRELMEGFHQQIAERIMEVALSSEEIWQSQMRQMQQAGYSVNEDHTYQEMKRFNDSKEYDIIVDQTHLIGMEFKLIDTVLECSARRNWCFVSAPEGSQFIASDDPVVLNWRDGDRKGPYPPGHGVPGTIVFFPLCSNLLLIGTFEDLPEKMEHTFLQVAGTNTQIAIYSTRQIYARDGSFILNLKSRDNVRGDELPCYFA